MVLSYVFSIDGKDAEYSIAFDESGLLIRESLRYIIGTRRGTLFKLDREKDPVLAPSLVKDRNFRSRLISEISQFWGKRSFIRIIWKDMIESNESYIKDNLNGNLIRFIQYVGEIMVYPMMFNLHNRSWIKLPSGNIPVKEANRLGHLEVMLSMFFSRLCTDIAGVFFETEEQGDMVEYRMFFRKRIAGKVRNIPGDLESTGTRSMINIMNYLLACVENKVVFVDEIEKGVHDLMITEVVDQILRDINGQLIATTHNTCLMDELPPDKVYVIAVDREGFKQIRCVTTIEAIKPNNSIRRKYYSGDFMGIPYISNLDLPGIAELGKEDI